MGHLPASVLRQVIAKSSLANQSGALPEDILEPEDLVENNTLPSEPSSDIPEVSGAESSSRPVFTAAQVAGKPTMGHTGHMKLLFDNAPVAMAMFDEKMRYMMANRRWVEDFKLQSKEITGKSQYELFPSLHPGWRHVYDRALSGQVVRSDRDAITQDGRPIIYRWEVRPWRHADTTIGGVMVTCVRLFAQPAGAAPVGGAEKPSPVGPASDILWESALPLLALDANGLILRASEGASSLFLSSGLSEGVTRLWEALGERTPEGPVQSHVLASLKAVVHGEKTQAVVTAHAQGEPGRDGSPAQWVLSRVSGSAFGVEGDAALAIGVSSPANDSPFDAAPLMVEGTNPSQIAEALEPTAPLISTPEQDEIDRLVEELQKMGEAEQTSRLRESRLRAVLDLAPCGLLVLDERARPIYHNSQVSALLGRTIAEGQSMEDWISDGSRDDEHKEEISRQWREGVWRKQLTTALTLTTADELLKDIEMRPVSLPGGGLMVMMQDVTDSQRSEEMLRSTEAKFRTLLHENPQPVVLTDRTGSVFDANPAAEALLGYTRAELRRMSMERWLEAGSTVARAQALREMVQHSDRIRELPVIVLNRERAPLNANLRLAIVPDVQGEPMFTVQFFMPVVLEPEPACESEAPLIADDEDHHPPAFMDDLTADLAMVTRSSTQDLLSTDVHGKITFWTADAEEQFGYTTAQMTGKGLHSLFRPSDATGFYGELGTLATDSQPVAVTWVYYHGEEGRTEGNFLIKSEPEGGLSIVLQRVFTLTVPAEAPAQREMAVAPARESKPEEELSEESPPVYSKPSPEELNREKILLGETHHRVKNHLQIITSMLNLQISTLHNEEARDALRSSQNRVRSIAALHQHLYQVASGESGEFGTFANELISHLRECFDVSTDRVRLELRLPEKDVPEEWLMPLALSLNEMVSNSFKHAYAHNREGDMTVELTWDEEEGQLTVTDDGGGLPANFDDHHPSGMGLKILRVFAGQLGGEIKVTGTPDEGTEFKLCFPVGMI